MERMAVVGNRDNNEMKRVIGGLWWGCGFAIVLVSLRVGICLETASPMRSRLGNFTDERIRSLGRLTPRLEWWIDSWVNLVHFSPSILSCRCPRQKFPPLCQYQIQTTAYITAFLSPSCFQHDKGGQKVCMLTGPGLG